MLTDSLFSVSGAETAPGNFKGIITLNPAHEIFIGHFPGMPVLPGVCMVQIFTELLENQLKYGLQLIKADHIKFLAVVNPVEIPSLNVEYAFSENQNGDILLSGKLFKESVTFLKLKSIYKSKAVKT